MAQEKRCYALAMMAALYRLIARVAPTNATVLLLGETGVGKEVVARDIHARSKRSKKPMVTINCAAIHETLLESELFGHRRGAYTGADRDRVGVFESAEGGTLFLDEIGEMPLSIQAKLLRVLEQREIVVLGTSAPKAIDVRIIAATNRNLETEIEAKRFRADLYYRINTIALTIPPLRQRQGEIMPLALEFAKRAANNLPDQAPAFSDDARAALFDYAWPGNIRELRNVVERAVVTCSDGVIEVDALRLSTAMHKEQSAPDEQRKSTNVVEELMQLERTMIIEALELHGHNQTRTAKALGISRGTLMARLARYKIRRPRAHP